MIGTPSTRVQGCLGVRKTSILFFYLRNISGLFCYYFFFIFPAFCLDNPLEVSGGDHFTSKSVLFDGPATGQIPKIRHRNFNF